MSLRLPSGDCRTAGAAQGWRAPCPSVGRRQTRWGGSGRRRQTPRAAAAPDPNAIGDPSLVVLPVFPLPNILHPTQQGALAVFEPQYVAMFGQMRQELAAAGGKGLFVHVLSPAAAPPALLENAVGGLPRVGCCAEVQEIEERPDGTLAIKYVGSRRVQLLMAQQSEPFATMAAEWYDDEAPADLDPTVDVLEKEAAKLLLQIERLTALVAPGEGGLPEAIRQYAPPAGVQKKTSYDALKAAGHMAAGHIDMWRRHGSVYKTQGRPNAAATDPYEAVREALSKSRRQELFSFAAAQLLVMGTPERAALLLSQDTAARLNFVLAALRPYYLELQAKAALKRSLE